MTTTLTELGCKSYLREHLDGEPNYAICTSTTFRLYFTDLEAEKTQRPSKQCECGGGRLTTVKSFVNGKYGLINHAELSSPIVVQFWCACKRTYCGNHSFETFIPILFPLFSLTLKMPPFVSWSVEGNPHQELSPPPHTLMCLSAVSVCQFCQCKLLLKLH